MKTPSLYEITKSINKLPQLIDDPEELTKYLDDVEAQRDEKVEGVIKYQRFMEVQADAVDNEIKRLQELKGTYKKRSENLKSYLGNILELSKEEEFTTKIARVFFRKSSGVVMNDKEVPAEYTREKVVKSVDRVKITKELKEGKKLDFAYLEERKNLQIK